MLRRIATLHEKRYVATILLNSINIISTQLSISRNCIRFSFEGNQSIYKEI